MDSKVYETKRKKTHNNLLEEYDAIRVGRANPHVLDRITVDYYGTPTPLQQIGNITVPEARLISITPWEPKMLKEIEKAINMSDLGINPTNDGKSVRLVFPEMTEERRKEVAKDVRKKGEQAKVAIRNIRRDANEAVNKELKAKTISEDEKADLDDEIQKMTDKYIKIIDQEVEKKIKDVMSV